MRRLTAAFQFDAAIEMNGTYSDMGYGLKYSTEYMPINKDIRLEDKFYDVLF